MTGFREWLGRTRSGPGSGSGGHSRIIRRTLLLGVIPPVLIGLVVVVGLAILSSRADQSVERNQLALVRDVVGEGLEADAASIARDLEQFMAERVGDVESWAFDPQVVRTAAVGGDRAVEAGLPGFEVDQLEAQYEQSRSLDVSSATDEMFREMLERTPEFVDAELTDRHGFVVAHSSSGEDFVQADELWWQAAWETGISIGNVAVNDNAAGGLALDIAVRVEEAGTGDPLGVIRVALAVDTVQQVSDLFAAQREANVSILTPDRLLVAETETGHAAERIFEEDADVAREKGPAIAEAMAQTQPGFSIAPELIIGYAQVQLGGATSDRLTQEQTQLVVVVDKPTVDALAPLAGVFELRDDLRTSSQAVGYTLVVVLLAVFVGAMGVALLLGRRLARPVRMLREAAIDVAENRLPMVVDAIERDGYDADIPPLHPIQLDVSGEVAELAQAFNSVQETAVSLAAEQAASRRRFADMFVSFGRRNQSLLGRQLEFIDSLEQQEADPDTLDSLFRLDHLATRMRRNAESLLVLAGAEQPRNFDEPLPAGDVIRGAVAEIEDYARVEIGRLDHAEVQGHVVSDVVHLLAELIENATNFSPPDSPVSVIGRVSGRGYVISIVDQGIGMTDEERWVANERLATIPEFEEVPTSYLGFYVVARLAARHNIDVRLLESPADGITAKIRLPDDVLTGIDRRVLDSPLEDGETDSELLFDLENDSEEHDAMVIDLRPGVSDQQLAPVAEVDLRTPDGVETHVAHAAPVELTPAGLPRRRSHRRRDDTDRPAGEHPSTGVEVPGDSPGRTPAQVRDRLDDFTSGVDRGRADNQVAPTSHMVDEEQTELPTAPSTDVGGVSAGHDKSVAARDSAPNAPRLGAGDLPPRRVRRAPGPDERGDSPSPTGEEDDEVARSASTVQDRLSRFAAGVDRGRTRPTESASEVARSTAQAPENGSSSTRSADGDHPRPRRFSPPTSTPLPVSRADDAAGSPVAATQRRDEAARPEMSMTGRLEQRRDANSVRSRLERFAAGVGDGRAAVAGAGDDPPTMMGPPPDYEFRPLRRRAESPAPLEVGEPGPSRSGLPPRRRSRRADERSESAEAMHGARDTAEDDLHDDQGELDA